MLRAAKVEAVAVCFMHSYANAANEEMAARRLRELLGDAFLSVSSRVLPQVRFYERVSTTVLNAAVGPVLGRYLDNLLKKIAAAQYRGVFLVMQSNGGVSAPGGGRRSCRQYAVVGAGGGPSPPSSSSADMAVTPKTRVHHDRYGRHELRRVARRRASRR